jgi:hypothetical protein
MKQKPKNDSFDLTPHVAVVVSTVRQAVKR